MSRPRLTPARLRPADALRVGGAGLRARPLRVFLSALGIAIGIAAIPLIFLVSVAAFSLTWLLPGDPAYAIAGIEAGSLAVGDPAIHASTTEYTDEVISRIRSKLEVWETLGEG